MTLTDNQNLIKLYKKNKDELEYEKTYLQLFKEFKLSIYYDNYFIILEIKKPKTSFMKKNFLGQNIAFFITDKKDGLNSGVDKKELKKFLTYAYARIEKSNIASQ